jgi:hypothetical protein
MTWLGLLALAVVLVAVTALLGSRPRGGRPVAGTQLMTVGRVVALVLALLIAYVAFKR